MKTPLPTDDQSHRQSPDRSDETPPQVAVAQLGARRRYLVPTTFESQGMLAGFYTDFFMNGPIARCGLWLSRCVPLGPLKRVAGRRDLELPTRKVRCFPWFSLRSHLRARRLRARGELTRAWILGGREFATLVSRQALKNADAIYAYSSAALELFQEAKRQGKYCILDHATAPKQFEDALTMQQSNRYVGWSVSPPQADRWAPEYSARQDQESQLADLIICGSAFVRNAVEAEFQMGHKCVIVPLGLRRFPEVVPPKPRLENRKLRVLFVGDDAIRKGIGDLCAAVEEFGLDRCEARVAGSVDLSEIGRAAASRTVQLLGPVPHADMEELYRWADVCVLPSVSDTFGLVILEALAHAVPVITTPNTGGADVIQDGHNGFIVPIMAPSQIASRLRQLESNPDLLISQSVHALESSRDFGPEQYRQRLIQAVCDAYRSWPRTTSLVHFTGPRESADCRLSHGNRSHRLITDD